MITQLCGSIGPDVWPEVEKLELYSKMELQKGQKRRVKERLRTFVNESNAIDLLDKMLTLNPARRINADGALDHSFFWEEPMPDREGLAKMMSNHTTSMFELLSPPRRPHNHHGRQQAAAAANNQGGAPSQQRPGQHFDRVF